MFGHPRRRKSIPSVYGAGSTSNTLESIVPCPYTDLVLSGKQYGYLADIGTQARTKLDLRVTQLAEKEGINEFLKAQNQFTWVRAMNNILNSAKEIVLKELIYGENAI